MVHRGRSLATWLPIPARVDLSQIVVVTEMTPQRVIRSFPHLPRRADLSDAESVLIGHDLEDVYLHEPARDTLEGLVSQCSALTASVAGMLEGLINELPRFVWPSVEWELQRRSNRALRADAFRGFDPTVPVADLGVLILHSRDAIRLRTMERLRRERAE